MQDIEINKDKPGSKRKAKKEADKALEQKKPVEPVSLKIDFSSWFNMKRKKGLVKFWQEETLLVFMKKQGLSETEDLDKYESAFKRF